MWLIVRDDSKPLNRNRNLGTQYALINNVEKLIVSGLTEPLICYIIK